MTQALKTEWIELTIDGSPMEAYRAQPETGGPWPAVLVFMEIFGVNAHMQEVTERIAAEGYVALAMNYYHRTTRNLELGYGERDFALGRSHKEQTTRDGLFADARACIEYLRNLPEVSPKDRMGSIGFCFGGHVAYLVATLPEIAATASFYGGGIAVSSPGGGEPTIKETPNIHGTMLCLFGERDTYIPLSQTVEIEKALRAANIPHEVVRYPAVGHGFFCNQREDYAPHEAHDAWERVKALFSSRLKQGVPTT